MQDSITSPMATSPTAGQQDSTVEEVHEQQNQPSSEETALPEADVPDSTDVTKRRVLNDYSSYKPISIEPGQEEIRLLGIGSVLNDDSDDGFDEDFIGVLVDLKIHEERYPYIALSYCWGDLTQLRKIRLMHARRGGGERVMDDDGQGYMERIEDTSSVTTFNVTQSLYGALESLHKAAPRLTERFKDEWDDIGTLVPVWIDALCINQSNLDERSSQVGMMGTIYSHASQVFIWLGEDERVMMGCMMVSLMTKMLKAGFGEEFDHMDPADQHVMAAMSHFTDGMVKIEGKKVTPEDVVKILDDFFSHPYFRRIWVLQEATVNAGATFIHTTKASLPWLWTIVADRFRTLWRGMFPGSPMGQEMQLPRLWPQLLHEQVTHRREIEGETEPGSGMHLSPSLYMLLMDSFDQFEATDLRDKLYALLDLCAETRRGSQAREELAPDYGKTVSEIFTHFTLWCIRRQGDLRVLRYLVYNTRRLLPEDAAEFVRKDGCLPASCLDARLHPSWAIWPRSGGFWAPNRGPSMGEESEFDLGLGDKLALFNLADHPSIKLPENLASRFLRLGGRRMGVVDVVFNLPIVSRKSDNDEKPMTEARFGSEMLQKEMAQHEMIHHVEVVYPYSEKYIIIVGSLHMLWKFSLDQLQDKFGEEGRPQENARYEGKEEHLFRDFLETILMSPVYRGDKSLDSDVDLDSPWSDSTKAASLAMHWIQSDDDFSMLPPRIGAVLQSKLSVGVPPPEMFPFLCRAYGRCLFITEDQRFGLCPPETRDGDIIVALFGSGVPFVIRPVRSESDFEGADWSFEGHEQFKDQLFRFIGECYVHERMSKTFFVDQGDKLGEMEVFNLC